MLPKRLESTLLSVSGDHRAANWIEPELTGEIGSVTNAIPARFDAFVRIFHPAVAADGKYIKWAEVATALGRDMHPLIQWDSLIGLSGPDDLADSEWIHGAPEQGNLSPEILRALCALLASHTRCAEHCFFGIWTGWTSVSFHWRDVMESPDLEQELRSGDSIPGPRFGLPPQTGRDYLLLSGPLEAAMEIADSGEIVGLSPTSPNLIWPADRAWFLASEIDFDSTLVGGSAGLIEAILNSSEIEALRIGASDSLAVDEEN